MSKKVALVGIVLILLVGVSMQIQWVFYNLYEQKIITPGPLHSLVGVVANYSSPSKYFNLTGWRLQRPVQPISIKGENLADYASQYFYYDDKEECMTLMCPGEGAHTRHSNCPRTELRHTSLFYVQHGYHSLNATMMISNRSSKRIGNQYDYISVVQQILGKDNVTAFPLIQVGWLSAQNRLFVEYRENVFEYYAHGPGKGTQGERVVIPVPIAFNTKFTVSLIVDNGHLLMYLNSEKYLERNVSSYWTPVNYFKIGNYFQVPEGVNMALYNDFFVEVQIFDLSVSVQTVEAQGHKLGK